VRGQKGTRCDCLHGWGGWCKLRWRNRLASERQRRDGAGRCRASRQTPHVRISRQGMQRVKRLASAPCWMFWWSSGLSSPGTESPY